MKILSKSSILLMTTLGLSVSYVGFETLQAPLTAFAQSESGITVQPVEVGANNITGQTKPGAVITMQHAASSDKVTATADAQGSFVLDLSKTTQLVVGDTLNFTANVNNNEVLTTSVKVVEASEVPLTIDPVYAGGNIVKGKTAPEATLTLMHLKSGSKVTVDADPEGNFTLALTDVGVFAEGDQLNITGTTKEGKEFYKELMVQAGETSSASTTSTTIEKSTTTTGGKEIVKHFLKIEPLLASDKLMAGQTSPKASVTILFERTDKKVTVDADDQGNWTVDLVAKGIELQAEDLVHGTATSTDKQTAVYGIEVAAGNVQDSQHFVKINKILDNDKVISGTTSPNSTVTVFFDRTKDKETVTADAEGNWSVQVPAEMSLQAGDKVNATSNNNNEGVAFVQTTVTGTQTTTVDQSKLPNTGEKSSHAVIASGLVTFLAGLWLIFKKKQ